MKSIARYISLGCLAVLSLCGCRRLDTIPYTPTVTPDEFLHTHPYLHVHMGAIDFIWSQPSSSVIVYLAGLYAIWAGYRLLSDRRGQQSRLWCGIGLCLMGLGALAAGTSYQALG